MTQGAVLFAHNNGEIDYVKLAEFSAQRIKKYLDLSVTLITDKDSFDQKNKNIFDRIIFIDVLGSSKKIFHDGIDNHKKLTWKNISRLDVYNLSPYDETLVLDVDHIISSNVLKNCFSQNQNFLAYKDFYDISGWRNIKEFKNVSDYSIPFYWATIFWFRKCPDVELFFSLLSYIRSNWHYYKTLYQIHATNFRNDYAFSIALHTINGFVDGDFAGKLPGKMFYSLDLDFLEKIDENKLLFLVQKENANKDYVAIKTEGLDVHVMNKYSLLRNIINV